MPMTSVRRSLDGKRAIQFSRRSSEHPAYFAIRCNTIGRFTIVRIHMQTITDTLRKVYAQNYITMLKRTQQPPCPKLLTIVNVCIWSRRPDTKPRSFLFLAECSPFFFDILKDLLLFWNSFLLTLLNTLMVSVDGELGVFSSCNNSWSSIRRVYLKSFRNLNVRTKYLFMLGLSDRKCEFSFLSSATI